MKAADVTAGLAESDGSLLPDGWLKVTCRLTACTSGSALGPTLGNKYGKTLPFTGDEVNVSEHIISRVDVCVSSTLSSGEIAKARPASGSSDVEVMIGRVADEVDELPIAADRTAEKLGDMSSTSETTMRRKREFMTSSVTQEQHYELQTSVASTMTPFRCAFACVKVK